MVTEQPSEPEVFMIKEERLEEELTGYRLLEDHQTPPNSNSMFERLYDTVQSV